MELSQYRQNIAAPVLMYGDSIVGHKLTDDSTYDYVDDQMMKVGSLSHDTIEWDTVEEKTMELLTEHSKDIKLLTYLIQCLYHSLSPQRFNVSLLVLGEFIDHFWEEAFPVPGPKGKVPRKRLLSQIAQRMREALDRVDLNRFSGATEDELRTALDVLDDAIEKRGIDSDELAALIRNIRSQLSQATERRKLEQVATTDAHSQSASTSSSNRATQGHVATPAPTPSSSTLSKVTVDTSSDKATRTTLLKIAEFLGEQEAGSALSVRVRRHAVWSDITSVPDHNPQGETLLRPMQQDRVKDYEDGMSHPDVTLWHQVEQSLTLAPYWFDGHLMSYQIAQALKKPDWCDAIKDETKRFLERLPKLKDLAFKGGVPFVSADVAEWLAQSSGGTGNSGRAEGWADIRKNIIQIAVEKNINEALVVVNEGLENATEPRAQWYWRLVSADLMKAQGFEAMAKESYRTLYHQALDMTVPDWEPSVIQQLEKYTTSE